jgi:hypothetical protein
MGIAKPYLIIRCNFWQLRYWQDICTDDPAFKIRSCQSDPQSICSFAVVTLIQLGNEREVFGDRGLRMLLTQKQPDQSSGLIGFLLKTGWEKG